MSADSYNEKQLDAGNLTMEMVTELGRQWQRTHPPLAVDGYIGPATQSSISQELHPVIIGPPFENWDGPLARQPTSRTELYQMLGNPGAGSPDPAWERENIIECQGEKAFPGVPEKWYFKIHKDLEPYAREGFRRAAIASDYVIERAACYVFRHIRFDPKRALSVHSWGAAIDLDRERNDSHYLDPANLPEPWSDEWMRIWPVGLDKPFVDAMKSCGWHWGGFWQLDDGFVDPMHFQWVGRGYTP